LTLLALLVLFVPTACGAPPATRTRSVGAAPKAVRKASLSPEAKAMLALVNKARSQGRSCGDEGYFSAAPPLQWSAKLAQAATAHGEDMMKRDYFGHTSPSGSTPGDRISATGYAWSWEGENIAFGYDTLRSVMAGWLASPGHCANIMRPQFTEMGAARVGVDWTQEFGTPMANGGLEEARGQ
jgi:uncharacterized protein YkwD